MYSVFCPTCGATCASQDQLINHQRQAYHGFQCLLCGAELTTRDHFAAHVTQEHFRPPSVTKAGVPLDAARTGAKSTASGGVR
jgi:predicted RNA-binding Zn-ribbon protein involved in translation (DUF1610 family)